MNVVNGFAVELVGRGKRAVAVAHCLNCGELVLADGSGDVELVEGLAEMGRCGFCADAGA